MKRLAAIGCVAILCKMATGQTCDWQIHGGTICAPAGTAVGVGTSTPKGMLQVNGLSGVASAPWNIYTLARFSDGGLNSNSAVLFDTSATGATGIRGFTISKGSQDFFISRYDSTGAATPVHDMAILSNGNVGIGTSTPQHLLHVAGTISATEVIVSSTGADYVFEPGYRLRPLSDVADYIKQNHHLPEIPSAKEAEEKGTSVGAMQAKLLAKIEEITLHMIEAEERSGRLERDNAELREKVVRVDADVRALRGRRAERNIAQ